MVELFEVGDVLKTPQGTAVGGSSEVLSRISEDELGNLLGQLKKIDIVDGNNEFTAVPVRGYSVTTSLAGQRNIFILIEGQLEPGDIAVGAKVRCEQFVDCEFTATHPAREDRQDRSP